MRFVRSDSIAPIEVAYILSDLPGPFRITASKYGVRLSGTIGPLTDLTVLNQYVEYGYRQYESLSRYGIAIPQDRLERGEL